MKKFFIFIAVVFGSCLLFVAYYKSGLGVGVTVNYDQYTCSEEHPLLVKVTNRMPIQLDSYTYYLTGKREGYSDIVFSRHDGNTKIIPAFSSSTSCWKAPDKGYEWRNKRIRVSFAIWETSIRSADWWGSVLTYNSY